MIVYTLVCFDGHEFEGWFSGSTDFDTQSEQGLLACPMCGDSRIGKAIMSPSVKNSVTKAKGKTETPPPPDPRKVRQFMAGYRKFIEDNADYVGKQFPEEARKIHYGETEERHIYGESTVKEAKELIEEGVKIAPMPPKPEELN